LTSEVGVEHQELHTRLDRQLPKFAEMNLRGMVMSGPHEK